jgi:hypothetical protein
MQVGRLTLGRSDDGVVELAVISARTPDEVHAVLRGEDVDPTRTVYDPPPAEADAQPSSTAERT